ncbi:MAG: GspH/FimT family pseudopilin [Gammaproteobacteria bacterium]|nr:GspH/FimT family pseudopilin [Gammaproteobacteria bacterium]
MMVMIGIILTFASLSVGDGGAGRRAQQEIKRLRALIEMASDEAIMQGVQLGIEFGRDHYRFLIQEGEAWFPYDLSPLYRQRQLPPPLSLQLVVEGLPLTFPGEEAVTAQEVQPQVYLLSSGERTPFELLLMVNEEGRIRLHAPLMGEITAETVGALS